MSARTVKVWIAVAVTDAGEWLAAGDDKMRGDDAMRHACDTRWSAASNAVGTHWVTATLPIPEPVEVAGVVEDTGVASVNRLRPEDGWQPYTAALEIRARRIPVEGALFSENYEVRRRAVDDDSTTYEDRVRRRVARQEG